MGQGVLWSGAAAGACPVPPTALGTLLPLKRSRAEPKNADTNRAAITKCRLTRGAVLLRVVGEDCDAVEGAVVFREVQPALEAVGAPAADACGRGWVRRGRGGCGAGGDPCAARPRLHASPPHTQCIPTACTEQDACRTSLPICRTFPGQPTKADDVAGRVLQAVCPLGLAQPAQGGVQGDGGDQRIVLNLHTSIRLGRQSLQ